MGGGISLSLLTGITLLIKWFAGSKTVRRQGSQSTSSRPQYCGPDGRYF